MADASVFRGTIDFFNQLGVYDVILPFLLTFTIVFAIMEKTKILGKEWHEESQKELPKKNLNAMVAFVIAFFVVASSELVRVINEALANIVLLLLLSIGFMLLVGSFHNGKDEFVLKGGWKTAFMVIMFIGIVLIFMSALHWLDKIYDWLKDNAASNWVSGLILVALVIGFMVYVTHEPSSNKDKKSEDS